MRFTLKYLFVAVAMLALACAGMTYRTRGWTNTVITVTLGMYAVALIAALGSSGRQRVSAFAFAFTGAGYVLFMAFDGLAAIRDSLLTNYVLGAAWTAFVPPDGQPPQSEINDIVYWVYHERTGFLGYTPWLFFAIGHCVWSWIFAVLAGWFAGRMYDRRGKLNE
jgi:hypothetical protein